MAPARAIRNDGRVSMHHGSDELMPYQRIKFYQTGSFAVGNRLLAEDQRSEQASPGRSNALTCGHRACQGRGEALGARYALDAVHRATDGKMIAVNERLRKAPDAKRAEAYRLSLEGWRRIEHNDIEAAANALTSSLALNPLYPVAHYRYGRVQQARVASCLVGLGGAEPEGARRRLHAVLVVASAQPEQRVEHLGARPGQRRERQCLRAQRLAAPRRGLPFRRREENQHRFTLCWRASATSTRCRP